MAGNRATPRAAMKPQRQYAGSEAAGDAGLIERIRSGDRDAEESLYRRYAERIYYLALKRTGVPADAEDVRSETFLRVLAAIRQGQLREPAAFAGYCFRTLDNVAAEMARRARRTQELTTDAAAPAPPEPLDDNVMKAIHQAIARLKPREREFLRMYYYDEL